MTTSQVVMLVLAVVCLTAVMLSTRRRIRESKALDQPSARRKWDTSVEPRRAARDLEQVMLELDQLSRQIHGRIDTKLAKIETLLRDADARIEKLSRLRTALDSSKDSEDTACGDASARPPLPTPSPTSRTTGSKHSVILELAKEGRSMIEIAREVGKTPGEVELVLALRDSQNH